MPILLHVFYAEGYTISVQSFQRGCFVGRNAFFVIIQICQQTCTRADEFNGGQGGNLLTSTPNLVVSHSTGRRVFGIVRQRQNGAGFAGFLVADEGHCPVFRCSGVFKYAFPTIGADTTVDNGSVFGLARSDGIANQDIVPFIILFPVCLDFETVGLTGSEQRLKNLQFGTQSILGKHNILDFLGGTFQRLNSLAFCFRDVRLFRFVCFPVRFFCGFLFSKNIRINGLLFLLSLDYF